MVDTVIIGSFGIDDVETPFDSRKNIMGGSVPFAAYAATFFKSKGNVGVIGIIGEDYPKKFKDILTKRGIDLEGLQVKGKTFRWGGKYKQNMDDRDTIFTELNSMMDMDDKVPESYRDAKYIMLGNLHPALQLNILKHFKSPKLVVLDTMDLWIKTARDDLIKVIKKSDILVVNDSEAKQLFNTVNLAVAAGKALDLGLKSIIIKKGENGAVLFTKNGRQKPPIYFNAPGYPLYEVKDPTGCGDSFAGGFLGYVSNEDNLDEKVLRKAIIYGSVIASFNAESFSLDKLQKISIQDIEGRYMEFEQMREF